jgi:hypothetical protein
MHDKTIYLTMRRVLIGVALAAGVMPAEAECQIAANSYNLALDDISISMRRYTGCLQTSRVTNSCTAEFRRLHLAQEDFEAAVSQRLKDCRE